MALASVAFILAFSPTARAEPKQAQLSHQDVPLLRSQGLLFKDLNRNGKLDAYEDWRLPAKVRAKDLLARMSLEEKAGAMVQDYLFQPTLTSLDQVRPLIQSKYINHFNSGVSATPRDLATLANAIQRLAEETRLAIPVTLSSDPRNHFTGVFGVGANAGRFSHWPDPPGLAATGDFALVRKFGEIASQEYRAVGLREALSPQADLATEPRWSRISGTFGSSPTSAGKFVRAYVEGFQGGGMGLGPNSVAAVVKHWVGYGAEPGGYDAHNPYGRDLAFPGGRFEDHVLPFIGAISARAAGIMPTYGRPPLGLLIDGKQAERVGASFSRQMLAELLREKYRFQGIILSDFKITDDCSDPCQQGTHDITQIGMPWGVEQLTKQERFAKSINAGVDQIGGTNQSEFLVEAVKSKYISIDRIDESVLRLLIQKFELGLFEDAYVVPEEAEKVVGAPNFQAAALDAQHRSLVLLENSRKILPLDAKNKKLWLWQVSPEIAADYGFTVVSRIEEADLALAHITTPFTNHANYLFGSIFHEGSLSFAPDNADRRVVESAAAAHVPIIVIINLDRAAVLTPIRELAAAIVADFGVSDEALFDVLTGRSPPVGHLPFELPSSDIAVNNQKPDVPDDSINPLYPNGAGLHY
jgi:beta-glucosidase